MISSMASSISSSSATVRVEKATSEFLIGPDWALNMDICDIINSNQMLAKDVLKAVKKRLQHKNPKIQLLALTLLETLVKNCGDYVHFQIAERDILQEMVKIVRKNADMRVRDKILTLIGSWHEAFSGGPGGRYPQYHMAYEDLRRSGVHFPRHSPDAAPIFTPPVRHPTPRYPLPGYGMPSSSSTRLDEAMASEENISMSTISSMREVLNLLADMLRAVDPNDRFAIKDEVILDLVEQCRANQRKLMQFLGTARDEELLRHGLELNDNLQHVLAKHDAIASGSLLPPEVANVTPEESDKPELNLKSAESTLPDATCEATTSLPVDPTKKNLRDEDEEEEEEEEEEDEFAMLARRHTTTGGHVSRDSSTEKGDLAGFSNALVPVDPIAPVQAKDQDIIDLLSLTLSTTTISSEQTSQAPVSQMHDAGHIPLTSPYNNFSTEAYPGHPGFAFNGYVAPWANPQPQQQTRLQTPQHEQFPYSPFQPEAPAVSRTQLSSQPQHQQVHSQPQPQPQLQQLVDQAPQHEFATSAASNQLHSHPQSAISYPPPPWASTPGYFSSLSSPRQPYAYSNPPINVERQLNNSSPMSQKPFIPSYRLFEDLDVFGSTGGKYQSTSNNNILGSSNSMVGGRK